MTINQIIAERVYRGHNSPKISIQALYIWTKHQVRDAINRDFHGRPAVEPVIDHLKDDHNTARDFLHHTAGDASNAILAVVGYNIRRIFSLAFAFTRLVHFVRHIELLGNYYIARA